MDRQGIDRRRFLTTSAAGAGGLLAAASGTATAAARPPRARPNILWFISDDASAGYLGAYGDRVARTPTIDRLARQGIRYETAYSDAPVCSPSRFTLITGLHSPTAGPAHHHRAAVELPAHVRGWPEYLRRAGYYTFNRSKTDYNADIDMAATWDASTAAAHWRNRPDGAPFFGVITTLTSHESGVFGDAPPQTPPSSVRIPDFMPDTDVTRTDKARYYDNLAAMDGELATVLAQLEADGLAEETIVFYFSDNGGVLPGSKRFTDDRGLRVPLIVRIPPRFAQLAPAGPGSVEEMPVGFVDFAPTVLQLAGLTPPEYMQGASFLGRRPEKRRYTYGHRGRMDEQYDLRRAVRDERYLYVRNYLPHLPYGQISAYGWKQRGYQEWEQLHLDGRLTVEQERFFDEKPSEELYDIWHDPEQTRDLAREPRHRAVLERLRGALDEHLVRINDNGFIPEGSPLMGYEASRVPGAYPIRRVLRVAGTAIERDARNLEVLVDWLDDDNEVVRYWAVQGILMLGDAGQPALAALDGRLDADPSPFVRIAAAEALARLGHTGRPVAFLAATADDAAHVWPRVHALTALKYVGVAALPYLAVVERAAETPAGDRDGGTALRWTGRYLRFVLTGTYTPTAPVSG